MFHSASSESSLTLRSLLARCRWWLRGVCWQSLVPIPLTMSRSDGVVWTPVDGTVSDCCGVRVSAEDVCWNEGFTAHLTGFGGGLKAEGVLLTHFLNLNFPMVKFLPSTLLSSTNFNFWRPAEKNRRYNATIDNYSWTTVCPRILKSMWVSCRFIMSFSSSSDSSVI